MKNKNIISIIPARGGSKRIPEKNIANVAGKPLIYHAIKASLECRLITSTDDEKILDRENYRTGCNPKYIKVNKVTIGGCKI